MVSKKKLQFLFGFHPVLEKLKDSPQEVIEVLIVKGHQRANLRSVEEEARRQDLPVRYLESAALNRLVGGGRHSEKRSSTMISLTSSSMLRK